MKTLLIAVALLAGGAASAAPIAPPGRKIHVDTPTYEFTYSYPAAAGGIPALKAWLDKEAAKDQASIASEGQEARDEARKDHEDYNKYRSDTDWLVVTDLPGWLSLSGTSGAYTGGAHGNYGPMGLLWDKGRNRRIEATDLFVSKAALSSAIRAPFCAELNRQRAKKRGEPVDPKSTDAFDACIDPAMEVVILGSADHAHFTRIGILIAPYSAGPYSDGQYDVTLPVTPALISAVRPEYRSAFALAPAQAGKK